MRNEAPIFRLFISCYIKNLHSIVHHYHNSLQQDLVQVAALQPLGRDLLGVPAEGGVVKKQVGSFVEQGVISHDETHLHRTERLSKQILIRLPRVVSVEGVKSKCWYSRILSVHATATASPTLLNSFFFQLHWCRSNRSGRAAGKVYRDPKGGCTCQAFLRGIE